jgi:DNA-directed RNA polymerase specialized sigma24 family protein
VWRIVLNAARDARRRNRPGDPEARNPVSLGDEPSGPPLELLSERQREVVFLHYYADLDYAAIGSALGISPGTVGATLTAARRRLRNALQEVHA